MVIRNCFAACTLIVLACVSSPSRADESAHYMCADKTELTATFTSAPGAAELVFAGSNETIRLPQAVSADGGRYASGETEFWIKGREATLTRGNRKTICKS
jgi:membrane-bound inhibitor of C-type lysozyme